MLPAGQSVQQPIMESMVAEGENTAAGSSKKAATKLSPQPFFRAKDPGSHTCGLRRKHRLSSSPDLRICSPVQPSQLTPMTDFRHVQDLHAYSGGTVRDSHPIIC